MFSHGIEHPAKVDDTFAVESQGLDGRPARGSQADQLGAVLVPGKMLSPGLPARVEQRDQLSRYGVARGPLGVLVVITALASQRQVFKDGGAELAAGLDVFDRKRLGGKPSL